MLVQCPCHESTCFLFIYLFIFIPEHHFGRVEILKYCRILSLTLCLQISMCYYVYYMYLDQLVLLTGRLEIKEPSLKHLNNNLTLASHCYYLTVLGSLLTVMFTQYLGQYFVIQEIIFWSISHNYVKIRKSLVLLS